MGRNPVSGCMRLSVTLGGVAHGVAEAVGAGVQTLVTDYPLGRLLACKGAAVMCEGSPRRLRSGSSDCSPKRGRGSGAPGGVVAAENLSWDRVAGSCREQVHGLIRAGTSSL
jgi:hypothetical protein